MQMIRPQTRQSTLPDVYTARIEQALKARGYTLSKPKALAEAVLQLSDFYNENPNAATPWDDVWAQVASLVYFFPLNYSRAALVAREAQRLGFFDGLTSLNDDGAGMGSGIHAFFDRLSNTNVKAWHARDVAPEALELLKELAPETEITTELVRGSSRTTEAAGAASLLIASYVFTELAEIPKEWLKHEALILIEPSTRDDARRLQGERKALQEAGFTLWAPCPHQDDCPLLIHSDKDWCHDRLHFEAPEWFKEIEKHLPIKNRTLTFSYLVARKKPAPVSGSQGYARLVGDMLIEKGKTRIALCRSSEKEYLTWFPQRMTKGDSLELERGSLVKFTHSDLEKKANEVRVKSSTDLQELATDQEP